MKKTLTKDITRYDDKMKLRLDAKTFKAIGISLAIAAPIFALLYFTAGAIPAVMVSLLVFGALVMLQVGTVQGIPATKYVSMIIKLTFSPRLRAKPYSRETSSVYNRITVFTETELKQKRKETENAKKQKKR